MKGIFHSSPLTVAIQSTTAHPKPAIYRSENISAYEKNAISSVIDQKIMIVIGYDFLFPHI